jgi:hypothetical protein
MALPPSGILDGAAVRTDRDRCVQRRAHKLGRDRNLKCVPADGIALPITEDFGTSRRQLCGDAT